MLGRLPTPLTSFVGRDEELATLAALVRSQRSVTATGPGGVGKTRLGIAAAEQLDDEFPDGVAFVDLVGVISDEMVMPAIADSLGVAERSGMTRRDAVVASVGDLTCLLVVDNCEHVLAGARACIADLLASCPALRVLATSRTRLLSAGEAVFAVPGMSVGHDDRHRGDAVELFTTRVAEGGLRAPLTDDDLEAAEAICERLDGMALAIELAAARVPSFGLDGVRQALTEGQEFLTLAHALDERHGSLRTAIDWSYRLLDGDQQRLLRVASVFAAPFDLDAAAAVTGAASVDLLGALGRLVDWNLIGLRPGRPTRYRVLETIRQYAVERAAELGELQAIRARHLGWCAATMSDLLARAPGDAAWCGEVDHVMDDARAALGWSIDGAAPRAVAAFAELIGAVSFQRGRPSEAQHRYEQAAALTDDGDDRHRCLLLAAGSALCRYVGDESVALFERATDGAPDDESLALDLCRLVAVRHRHDGTMSRPITTVETEALLDRARQLAHGSTLVEAAIAVAVSCRNDVPRDLDVAERAVALSRAAGDALLGQAAFDELTVAYLEARDHPMAAATVAARLIDLTAITIDAASGMDHADAHLMAAHVDLSLGRLRTARTHADALATLPFLREEPHVGVARRIEVDALAGNFDDVLRSAEAFRVGWLRAGRQRINNFGPAAYATAMVHGIRGDRAARAEWIDVARSVLRDPDSIGDASYVWPAVLDGLLALHLGDAATAVDLLPFAPDQVPPGVCWYQQLWMLWYTAAWAEAGALARVDGLDDRLRVARSFAGANEIAQLVIDRSAALAGDEADALGGMAERFERLGCPYQATRTRALQRVADDPPGPLAALSARELEVLELVASGRTNPQIAEALYISRKTAEHHVSNILTKLGVRTRSEAAVLAARQLPAGA